MDHFVDLDIVGALERTNKSSVVALSADYLRHYDSALRDFRDQKINMIELGVQTGASIRIWRWFLRQAQIIGVDIDPRCVRAAGERVKIEIGSQTDGDLLDRICSEHPPTIIVDDASHVDAHIIFSFERMFERLLPGGVYIVEDIGGYHITAAERASQAKGPEAADYFLELARACISGKTFPNSIDIPAPIRKTVDEVVFLHNAVLIRKKHITRDVQRAIETGETYMATGLPPVARDFLAAYALRHEAPPARVDAILDECFAANGPGVLRLFLRAENLLRQGLKEAAVATMKQAEGLPPAFHLVMKQMSALQQHLGDDAGALKSAEAALAARPRAENYKKLVISLRAKAARQRVTTSI